VVAEASLDVRPPQPLWEKLLRGAVFDRPRREPASLGQAGGFLMRVALRLVLVVVLLVVALGAALYLIARSL